MFSRKKHPGELEKAASSAGAKRAGQEPSVILHETSQEKPLRRNFPGPRGAQSPLRVAIERSAHAELIAHAKESLNAEICGVLAGRVCEDDEGLFVHVEAAIRGTAANQGSTHVTFTHETWNAIHQTLERDHPGLRIVGWYHSHPGFGVEFSEMDVFIQRNFFASPTQIALVMDPLSGNVAVCINTPRGIQYLPRYWVDGREFEGKAPAVPAGGIGSTGGTVSASGDADQKLHALDERLSQLVVAVDDLRSSMYRFLMFAGVLVAVGILVVAGYAVFYQFKARVEPPKNVGFAEVPVRIGDHTALLGVQIVQWKLPPELDVTQHAIEQLQEQFRKGLEELAGAMLTNSEMRREFEQSLGSLLTNASGSLPANAAATNKSTRTP